MFLANRDTFTTALKTALDASVKDDDVLEDLAETCADLLEGRAYVYPETKHDLLKALAFALVLVDKEGLEKKKDHLFKNKKSMDRFVKLIKATPVVPLFGDVSTTLESILKKAKHMEPGKFSYDANDEALKKSYSILASLPEVREQYKSYVADFGVVMNEVWNHILLLFLLLLLLLLLLNA